MKRLSSIVCVLLFCLGLCAQTEPLRLDSSRTEALRAAKLQPDPSVREDVPTRWRPDAPRAVWMGILCPGLGQIYNRSYWKLPIVYGGFMGCGFAVGFNQSKYDGYRNAYRELYSDRDNRRVEPDNPDKSYVKVLPKGYTIDRMGGVDNYLTSLNNNMNIFRRYRDLSIAATALVYALGIVEAYVDARLYDFDISPDLSLRAEPALYIDPYNNKSFEAKIALTLK